MEEIVQILIFVAAMVITIVGKSSKSKKQPATPSPEEVLEEVFPDTSDLQSEDKAPQAQPIRPIKTKRTSSKIRTPRVEPQQEPLIIPKKQTDKIKLNTRAEARKAFIYSEIFNRKYQ